MKEYNGYLTIEPPFFHHDDVEIIGTREALSALQKAIQKVLYSPSDSTEFNTFNTDGEGYTLKVTLLSEDKIKEIDPLYINYIVG